jgi:catechol 2,3-dioxygenase-like lactoylglutathione lyase family enzyme
MNITQIKESCLYFSDLTLARDFYHGILGFPVISYLASKHIFFRAGSSVLLCFNPDESRRKTHPPGHYGEGKNHLAFEVPREEYELHKKELLEKGIQITDKVVWENGQESFYFEDPAQHVLEIVPEGVWK